MTKTKQVNIRPAIYVTMTDKGMSGWGPAKGKLNKLVFRCDSVEEAKVVMDNAKARGDMKHINVRETRPSYPDNAYFAQYKDKNQYPNWYKPNFF